jgi:CoA:oxalate CoA-transferase
MPALPTSGPLEGIRVLDLTWVLSGPFCTATLADLGADVIKLERPPYGDVSRTTGPIVDGESGYFFSVNRGKRSVALDLSSEEGRAIFLDLVRQVDVVVENFTAGTMDRLGLGYDVLSEVNPRVIYAAISGFGQTGPMRSKPALDVIVQGAGGIMSVTGEPGGPPVRPGMSLGDVAAGLYCTIGVLAALQERERSGQGQMLDISMLDCQVAIQENAFMRYHITGDLPQPLGTRHPTAVPFQAFPTSDGWMVIALAWGVPNQWALMCAELGLPELIDDPRFHSAAARSRNHGELEPILNEAFQARTTQEWIDVLETFDVPCGPLNNIKQVTEMEQVQQRDMFVPVEHHTFGQVPLTNTPVKLSRTPAGIRGTSPDMGQHSREVLAELLGIDTEAVESLIASQVVWEERPEVELG